MERLSKQQPWDVLPRDVSLETPVELGALATESRKPSPPSAVDLARAGLIAPADHPDRWFEPDELRAAAWLRSRGLAVRAVRRREGRHLRTPDAVAIEWDVTIEIKHASATTNAIVQRIRSARWQARHVVVDLRGSAIPPSLAEDALRKALLMYGNQLREVLLILSDDLGVGWSYG